MNELVKLDPKEFGLEEKSAVTIEQAFTPKIIERDALATIYEQLITKELTTELSEEAHKLKKKLVKVRTGIAEIHKTQKAFYRAGGLYVDAWKNKETKPVEQMEEKLTEIKDHFDNLEKEKIDKLNNERIELCRPFVEDESLILPDLGAMPTSLWDNYIIGLKTSFEAREAAEKKAEEERIAKEKAEIAEQKRIREENAKLKKQAEETARLAKIEEDKQIKRKENNDRLNKAAKARQELLFEIGVSLDFESCKTMDDNTWKKFYEEKNKAYQSEQNRLHIEKLKADKKEAEQKANQAKLESELKAKEQAEQKAKEEEEARKQAELSKCDSDKVADLVKDLENLKSKYSFKSAKNKKMYSDVGGLLDKVVSYIGK